MKTTILLVTVAALLPGCVFAVGGTHQPLGKQHRVDRLERRIEVIEARLAKGQTAPTPAEMSKEVE
jgi:hypothetical protein